MDDPSSFENEDKRLERVIAECCEALDHLRRAVDHADGADPFILKLVATMRRVANLADDVIAVQGNGPTSPLKPLFEAKKRSA